MNERLHNIRQRAQAALGRTAGMEDDMAIREIHEATGETPPQWQAPEPVRQRTKRVHHKEQERLNAIMDRGTQARWDRWCDARIRKQVQAGMNDLAAICGQGVAHFVAELRKEIGELRSEIAMLRGVADGSVAPIKDKQQRHG